VSINPTYTAVSPIVMTAPPAVAWVTPTTNASRHHATASLMAAQVSAMTPIGVRCSAWSPRMRASTGNAVIDSDTPKNSANGMNPTTAGA
jgi:hypothetical protein